MNKYNISKKNKGIVVKIIYFNTLTLVSILLFDELNRFDQLFINTILFTNILLLHSINNNKNELIDYLHLIIIAGFGCSIYLNNKFMILSTLITLLIIQYLWIKMSKCPMRSMKDTSTDKKNIFIKKIIKLLANNPNFFENIAMIITLILFLKLFIN
jgi:hypothetical protein